MGVLALVALVLVVLALRPANTERPPVAPFEVGALAASEDAQWRWVGPVNCNADADVVQLERRNAGGEWITSAIKLSNIYGLSFRDANRGVATGTTAACSRGVAVTSNAGRTWKASPENPVLLDAWYTGTTVWGVERVIGQPQLAAFRVNPRDRLVPNPQVEPIRPCAASDGVPDQVAFWDDQVGLLLCENDVIGARLLARTTNGAQSFEAMTDDRPQLGLAGAEEIIDLDIAGTESVWVTFAPGGACTEGEVRYSDSQGQSFVELPCPSESVDVDEVLDVAFTSDTDGVMLALRDRQPVMAATTDGGESWTEER